MSPRKKCINPRSIRSDDSEMWTEYEFYVTSLIGNPDVHSYIISALCTDSRVMHESVTLWSIEIPQDPCSVISKPKPPSTAAITSEGMVCSTKSLGTQAV